MVRRTSILIIAIVCLAAAGAALYFGLAYYGNSQIGRASCRERV